MVPGAQSHVLIGNCVTAPEGAMRHACGTSPIAYQRVPSEPAAIPPMEPPQDAGYEVTAPAAVIAPTPLLPAVRTPVNHRLPFGPAVIIEGVPMSLNGYSVSLPAGVIMPILFAPRSANQR